MSTSATKTARRGLPTWAWVLIVLLVSVTAAAVAVAVFAARGGAVLANPSPDPAPAATAAPATTASGTASTSPSDLPADGCVGGVSDLDRAVLTAQRQAPLTGAGAAAFTATLMRWAYSAPAAPFQKVTARQVLTADASRAARKSLSSTTDPEGSTLTVDFANGRYYVEAFDGTSAIVSWAATGHVTTSATPQGDALIGGSVHLKSINGVWRYEDQTLERQLDDLQRIGTPYSGGC